MKCPKCGFVTFDHLAACKKCQASLSEARQALGLAQSPVSAAALEAEAGTASLPEAQAAAPEPVSAAPVPQEVVVAEAEPGLELDLPALEAQEPGVEGPALEAAPQAVAEEPVLEVVAEVDAAPPEEATEPLELRDEVREDEIVEADAAEVVAEELAEAPAELEAEAEIETAGGGKASVEVELPPELAALMSEEAAEPEAKEDEALDLSGVESEAAAGLDDELKKFLEQEGTSLEELMSEEDHDDDQPPPAAAGGPGGPAGLNLSGGEGGAGGSQSACQAEPPQRAPFWARGLAFSVDTVVLLVLSMGLLASASAAFVWAAGRLGPQADPEALLRLALVMVPLAAPLSLPALGLAYFTCFHGLAGSTPGKMLLGLEVVSEHGGRLGCGRALLRSVGYLISALPLALGFLWAAGAERLAWHDLMAHSEVLGP